MDLSTALARIRTHYLDDDGSSDRFNAEALTPWLDEARSRVWSKYCRSGGELFDAVISGTTSTTGHLSLGGGRIVRKVRLRDGTNGVCDIQRVHRSFATSAATGKTVDVYCSTRPGTPTVDTHAVWPDADDLDADQPGLTRVLEEMLLRTTAEYALVKDGAPYETLRRANAEAWNDVKLDQELEASGGRSHAPVNFVPGLGYDLDPETDGIVVFCCDY